jgi:hypothetical protein
MTSLKIFQNELKEGMLNFLWRQWSHMGVASNMNTHDSWFVDPEVMLAFTSEIARYDARVFDEMLDWLLVNGQWINVQRLSTIIKRDNIGDEAVIGAIASWMTEHNKTAKWQGLARRMEKKKYMQPEPLFRFMKRDHVSESSQSDAHFMRYGLIRPVIATRNMTQHVNMQVPVNVLFKCRALFGIGNRADVILYLLTTDGGHPRQIASLLGYNHMRVQELLVGLAEAGAVTMRPVGRTKEYWIDKDRWGPVILGRNKPPKWIDWRGLARGLTVIWRQANSIDENRADDYVFASKMRDAMRNARDDLHASGIGFDIEDDKGHVAEDYLPVMQRTISSLFLKLNS